MTLPSGTRSYTYAEDMAILRTKTHWALFIGFLVLLFAMPLYLSNYWLGVVNLIGITLIAATGLNILIGYCGQLSIGHAGFMAVGAYTSAILTNRLELPFLVGLICAGLAAGAIGLIFGIGAAVATFHDVLAVLGVFSIIYGAFAAMAQTDFKRLVAYSSVNHMGFVLLGIAAAARAALDGDGDVTAADAALGAGGRPRRRAGASPPRRLSPARASLRSRCRGAGALRGRYAGRRSRPRRRPCRSRRGRT